MIGPLAGGGLAALLALAGIASYAVPAASQDSGERTTMLESYLQTKAYAGRWTLGDHLSLAATLPTEIAANTTEFYIGLAWGVESTGPNIGNSLKVYLTAIIGEERSNFAEMNLQLSDAGDAFSELTRASELKRVCPCGPVVVRVIVDIILAQSGGEYSYRLAPMGLMLWWKSADVDQDGIVQDAQWVSGIPQYSWTLGFFALAALDVAWFLGPWNRSRKNH